MKEKQEDGDDRVRRNTPRKLNEKIDAQTDEHIQRYAAADATSIKNRLARLKKEWDTERALELTSAVVILAGLTLAISLHKRWLILSALSAAFLAQHAIQGWCPPLPMIRSFGVRTNEEIDTESEALERILEKKKGNAFV